MAAMSESNYTICVGENAGCNLYRGFYNIIIGNNAALQLNRGNDNIIVGDNIICANASKQIIVNYNLNLSIEVSRGFISHFNHIMNIIDDKFTPCHSAADIAYIKEVLNRVKQICQVRIDGR